MSTCFLFPGQGAQYPGMARDLWEASAGVKELFTLASDSTGMDCERLLFEGSEEELKATDNTQVAVTLANVAAGLVLKERGLTPAAAAGFSLGEYAALHEAGVIRLVDLFPVVKARGELMEKASRNLDSAAGQAGMAAVLGIDIDAAVKVLKSLAPGEVFLANHSSPVQIVLAGTAAGLAAAEEQFKAAGARRYVILKVSAPFHSPLLQEAAEGLKKVLADVEFSDPRIPVYANFTGRRIGSGGEARENCVRQAVSTVRWVDEEQSMLADGYTRFLEVGPGSVLSGLWKSFNRELPCLAAGRLEDIEKLEG
jgi:[acyl-carrier-protein] S-malonyltransferase